MHTHELVVDMHTDHVPHKIHICIYVCVLLNTHIHIYTCTCMRDGAVSEVICIYEDRCLAMYIYIYMHVCVCAY